MQQQPQLSDYINNPNRAADVRRVPELIKQGYSIEQRPITTHKVVREHLMIISGGQTGADQGGLIAAARLGLPTGGVACHGWMTENGRAERLLRAYGLIEGPPASSWGDKYALRTVLNAAQADATIIFGGVDPRQDPGSYLTLQLARWYANASGKAYCHVSTEDLKLRNMSATVRAVKAWLRK